MRMIRCALLTLLLAPGLALAEAMSLVCTENSGNTVSFEVDTTAHSVKAGSISAIRVSIDANYISFTLNMNNADWYHSINRASGQMAIVNPKGEVFASYVCERARQRF